MVFVFHESPIEFQLQSPKSVVIDSAVANIDGKLTYIYYLTIGQPDLSSISEKYYTIAPYWRVKNYILRHLKVSWSWEIAKTQRGHDLSPLAYYATLQEAVNDILSR